MRNLRHFGLVLLMSTLALGIATWPSHAIACTSVADCDDGNPCTDELCDDTLGCVYANVNRACDDGNACSSGDACNAGTCVGGPIASGCTSCQAAAVLPPGGGTFTGVTSGTGSLTGSCGSTGPSPERVYSWTPTASGTAVIATCGSGTLYDSVLHVHAGTCGGADLGCNDDTAGCVTGEPNDHHGSRVSLTVTAGQTYVIVVDGYNGASGAYTLMVAPPSLCGNGVREGAEACDGGDVAGCPSGQCTASCTCVAPSGGLPDLVPQIVDVAVDFNTTVFAGDVAEGCAEATSGVDLLRFGAYSRNDGTADFTLGDPQCPTPCDQHPLEVCGDPDFVCSPAAGHNHAHYNNYARYDLLDATGQVIVIGHKQGYCLRDTTCGNPVYTCTNQGITAGCSDLYGANLGCQYLDITGIPGGTYTLRVTIDPFDRIPELSEGNNVAQQSVTIVRPGGATPTRTATPARTATRTPTPTRTATRTPTPATTASPGAGTPLPTQTPAATPTVNADPGGCVPVVTQVGPRTSYWRITPTYSCALGGACDTAYQIIKNPGTIAVCRVDAYLFNNSGTTGSLAFSLVNAARTTLYGTSTSVNVATLPGGTGLCVGGSTPGAACVTGTCAGGGTCDVDDDSNLTTFTFANDVNVSGDFLLAARPQSLSNLVRWADTSPDTAYENSAYNAWNPFPSMANTGSDYVFRIYARVPGTPTATVVATVTPTPMVTGTTTQTATPAVTSTSAATSTPIATATTGATSTPVPTSTAIATTTAAATTTPVPTGTVNATTTPVPTATVNATITPVPTGTVNATITPARTATATVNATTTPAATATTVRTTTPVASTTPVPTATAGAGACSAVISIPSAGGVFSGSTAGASSLAATCASTNTAPEQVYSWTPTRSGNAVIETCGAATSFDTVVSVRQASCTSGQERGCNDDTTNCNTGEPSTYHGSRVRVRVNANQTYFIVVDGYGGASGTYQLRVTPP